MNTVTASEAEIVARFVSLFQRLQRVPEGLLRGYDHNKVESVLTTLSGVHLGMGLMADDSLMRRYRETYETVQRERGWDLIEIHPPVPQMRVRGYNDERIVAEVITLELETWQRLAVHQQALS